jgi:hypothetical protein
MTILSLPSSKQNEEALLSPEQVASILQVSPDTLAIWRCTCRYPLPYIKVGRSVRYRLQAVKDFLASRTVEAKGGGNVSLS